MLRTLWTVATVALVLLGCTQYSTQPNMYHEVKVPKQFAAGRGWAPGPSDHERYVRSYEAGWWACVSNYALDIDRPLDPQAYENNGWGSEVDGARDGYIDAFRRIQADIRRFGKKQTQAYLREIAEGW